MPTEKINYHVWSVEILIDHEGLWSYRLYRTKKLATAAAKRYRARWKRSTDVHVTVGKIPVWNAEDE